MPDDLMSDCSQADTVRLENKTGHDLYCPEVTAGGRRRIVFVSNLQKLINIVLHHSSIEFRVLDRGISTVHSEELTTIRG